MTSSLRLIVVLLGAGLAWVASGATGYPYPAVDIPLLFVGFALSVCIQRNGKWTKRLLARAVVAAFSFRCLALWLLGNDAVRLMALRDAGIGLMVVGALAYTIDRRKLQTNEDGAVDHMPEEVCLGPNRSGDGDCHPACAAAPAAETKPSDVEPLQFSLQGTLFATAFVAALASLAVNLGVGAVAGVVVLGTSWWLLACLARIIKTGDHKT